MADVSVFSAISTSHARGMRALVFTTDLNGYCFYLSGTDLIVRRTTDGGATWTSSSLGILASGAIIAFDVWYDQWTPGDTGTKLWYAFFDATDDRVFLRYVETSNNTNSATTWTVFTGASAVAGRGAFVSLTKARSGYLYCAYDIDAGAERGLHRSTDGGVNWSVNLSTTFVEATLDTCKLYPASGTGDDNDCWALYYDASALALTLKLWDSSAATQVESATIGVAHTDGATDLTGQFGYDASVRHSDGHLIVAALSGRDVAASTHQVFDITSTSTITTKTAIAASTDDHYYPQVFIDQATDAIYVSYNGKRDGSEVLDTTTKVYYTKSTDGGTTWSAGDTAYMEGAAGVVAQVWTPLSGLRFYAVWRSGTTLVGNKVNSVSTPAGPASQTVSGAFVTSTSVVYSPQVVAPGAVTVTGATLASGSVVQAAHTVAAGGTAQALTGATLASTVVIQTPQVVTPGTVTTTGATIAVGSGVTAGTVTTTTAASGTTLASTALLRIGTVTTTTAVSGATLGSTAAVSPGSVLVGAVTITGATLGSTASVTAGTIAVGAVTVTGATQPSTLALFPGTATASGTLAGAMVTTTAQLFTGTVTAAAVTVLGATVASGDQRFAGRVDVGAVTVAGGTVASGSAVFAPSATVSVGTQAMVMIA